jgi:IclR family acetate operon transcriptional repressor
MSSTLERSFGILEYLSGYPDGASLIAIADDLKVPRSACHRLLVEMVRCGYLRQLREQGDYALTTKLAALGLSYLSKSGIVDIAQPLIDHVAQASGELVRLAIVDGDRLTFVAKAQGARFGLRYDPDMGLDVRLSCSAGGHAWLMTLPDERVAEIVSKQGFGDPNDYGPKAPTTLKALLKILQADRKRGFSMISEMYSPGMTAMAAPVHRAGQPAIGVITIAGPMMRLTEPRMRELAPVLLATAEELARASSGSAMFSRNAPVAASHV